MATVARTGQLGKEEWPRWVSTARVEEVEQDSGGLLAGASLTSRWVVRGGFDGGGSTLGWPGRWVDVWRGSPWLGDGWARDDGG